MQRLFPFAALALVAVQTLPLAAETGCAAVTVSDAYARVATAGSASGAAFMTFTNPGAEDCRLIGARTEAAARAELHTHEEDAQGVMRMIHVAEGFPVPAADTFVMERGGAHVMLMGLVQPLAHGDSVPLVLEFTDGAELTLEVPVDLERRDGHGHGSGGHNH